MRTTKRLQAARRAATKPVRPTGKPREDFDSAKGGS